MTLTELNGERGQAIAEAARGYEEVTGRMLTPAIANDIGYYIDRGIAPDLFIKAYEVTADKGLGWRYTRGILQNCLEEGIFTAYTWDWKLRQKKGLAQIKKEYGHLYLDEATICMILMVTVFKEDVENTAKDLERYLEAVKNGDTSEWDERWERAGCTFPSVKSE